MRSAVLGALFAVSFGGMTASAVAGVTPALSPVVNATGRDLGDERLGENMPPVCNARGSYFGNVGHPVTFNGFGSNDPDGVIVSYAWTFGDGSPGIPPSCESATEATTWGHVKARYRD